VTIWSRVKQRWSSVCLAFDTGAAERSWRSPGHLTDVPGTPPVSRGGAGWEGEAVRTDLAQAQSALRAAACRTADLLGSLQDGDLPVKGLTWTVGVIHGYDIARTVGYRWPISDADALLTLPVAETMIPLLVNPETARRHTASYEGARPGRPALRRPVRDSPAAERQQHGTTAAPSHVISVARRAARAGAHAWLRAQVLRCRRVRTTAASASNAKEMISPAIANGVWRRLSS